MTDVPRTSRPEERPRAVLLLGSLQIILGVFSFFGGFVHIFLGIGGLAGFAGSNVQLGAIANALGTSLVVFGVLFLICGILTLSRSSAAWAVSLLVVLAGLAGGVASLALGTVGAVPGVLLAIGVLLLLTRRSVREYLSRGSPPVART